MWSANKQGFACLSADQEQTFVGTFISRSSASLKRPLLCLLHHQKLKSMDPHGNKQASQIIITPFGALLGSLLIDWIPLKTDYQLWIQVDFFPGSSSRLVWILKVLWNVLQRLSSKWQAQITEIPFCHIVNKPHYWTPWSGNLMKKNLRREKKRKWLNYKERTGENTSCHGNHEAAEHAEISSESTWLPG